MLLAAVLTLIPRSTFPLGVVGDAWFYAFPNLPYLWVDLALGLLTAVAAIGAWFGHRAVIAVTALAAAGVWAYHHPGPRGLQLPTRPEPCSHSSCSRSTSSAGSGCHDPGCG